MSTREVDVIFKSDIQIRLDVYGGVGPRRAEDITSLVARRCLRTARLNGAQLCTELSKHT